MNRFSIFVLLIVTVVFGVSEAASKCEQEREEANGKGLGAFVPSCEADGTYSPLQCHGSTGLCHCAREDGTAINEPARGQYVACKCPRSRDYAIKHGHIGTYRPQCQKNGKYSVSQCWGSVGACWCVNEDTGEKFSNNPWDC